MLEAFFKELREMCRVVDPLDVEERPERYSTFEAREIKASWNRHNCDKELLNLGADELRLIRGPLVAATSGLQTVQDRVRFHADNFDGLHNPPDWWRSVALLHALGDDWDDYILFAPYLAPQQRCHAVLIDTWEMISALVHMDTNNQSAVPDFYTVHEMATLFQCSDRNVDYLKNAGTIPAPKRFGRLIRWSRHEIQEWMRADCPVRQQWEEIKKANR